MYNPNTNFGNGFFAMRKIIAVTSLILIAFLSGCASVPMAAVENDTARKSFPSPSPGTAGLYIYRNTSFGGAHKKDIFIDGERVAESAPMTYFYFEVEDGTRKLSTESEFSPNDLIVDVEKGNNYFVRQSIKMGVFAAGADLELVSDEEGKKGVRQCRLANNLYGNVPINTEGVNTPVLATQASPEGEISPLDYYGQAEDEISTESYNQSLWDKALVETGGDQNKTKAKYIELRANQLYSEKVGSVSDTSLYQQAAPVTPDTPIDISGTYISDITSNQKVFFGNIDGKLQFTLEQDGDRITAVNSTHDLKIWGTRKGNIIEFFVKPHRMNSYQDQNGVWEINSDGINITGSWKVKNWGGVGQWNLRRIE